MKRKPPSRVDWLAERKKGIGGSDLVHLFQLEDQGCQRQLYYDKAEVMPDYPDEDTQQMRRGRVLEEAGAQEYMLRTNRRVVRRNEPIVDPVHAWARVNIDREVQATEHGPGPLEIKTHNAFTFAKVKREGVKEGHILQLQHAIWLTKRAWGAFAILHPDSWSLLTFELERDDQVIAEIQRRGDDFWPRVTFGSEPERPYGPGHKLCKVCPWRQACHGAEAVLFAGLSAEERAEPLPRDEGLVELVEDYLTARAGVAAADATLELVVDAMKRQLGQATAVECTAGRVYFRPQTRAAVDVTRLRKEQPGIAEQYTTVTLQRPLRVYGHAGRTGDD